MGNCQAIDAAALVIQHPNGRIERLYWSITASEIMKLNPGHYVSLIIPLPPSDDQNHQTHSHDENDSNDQESTRLITRVKLLRSTDTLVLGRAYRLITSQEVMKVLKAKRHAKMKRNQRDLQQQNCDDDAESSSSNSDSINSQVAREERQKQRTGSTHAAVGRTKSWRPSLNSISEVAS